MSTSENKPLAINADFNNDSLIVELSDGRTISAPLAWYPRLLHATASQRKTWELLGGGVGIHWSDIDEDISVDGLLRGIPAIEVRRKARSV